MTPRTKKPPTPEASVAVINSAPAVFGANVQVGPGDLVVMQVNSYESQLEETAKTLRKEHADLTARVVELQAEVTKTVQGVVAAPIERENKRIATALNSIADVLPRATTETNEAEEDDVLSRGDRFEKSDQTITTDHKKNVIFVKLVFKDAKSGGYGNTLPFQMSFALPAEVKDLTERIHQYHIAQSEIESRLGKIKATLSNLPRLMRQAQGQITHAMLERSPEGKALLEQLQIQPHANVAQKLLEELNPNGCATRQIAPGTEA